MFPKQVGNEGNTTPVWTIPKVSSLLLVWLENLAFGKFCFHRSLKSKSLFVTLIGFLRHLIHSHISSLFIRHSFIKPSVCGRGSVGRVGRPIIKGLAVSKFALGSVKVLERAIKTAVHFSIHPLAIFLAFYLFNHLYINSVPLSHIHPFPRMSFSCCVKCTNTP